MKFLFEQTWRTIRLETVNNDQDEEEEAEDEIYFGEYFQIIDIVGKLANKAEPAESDETPSKQFYAFAKKGEVQETEDGEVIEYEYVDPKDMP